MQKNSITFFTFIFSLFLFTSCTTESENISSTSEPASSQRIESYTHSEVELELLDEVNAYRVSVGLIPLEIIEHISYKSSEHNDYMLANHTVTHEGFDVRKKNLQEVLGAYRVGENVAFAYSSVESTIVAWVNSESHRANLEGDYTHFGASIRIDDMGKKYYTNMFIKK